jgi:hypothetical protein
MTEKFRGFEHIPPIEVGDMVALRDGLPAAVRDALAPELEPGVMYRVFHMTDEDGAVVAYVGPHDLDVPPGTDFSSIDFDEWRVRYPDVRPLSVRHLKKLGH